MRNKCSFKVSYQIVGGMPIVDQLVVDDDGIVVFNQLIVFVGEHYVVRPGK